MECNKDEACKAKKLAEEKMAKNEFEGARMIALKAKQLFPELENISQMITVCDIHCSAQKIITGAGKDLYGILQLENLADETTIRKQYRKLALVLHPDKNKFPGAEAAFKLIGEANMILSDKERRSVYDIKCKKATRATVTKIQNRQGSQTSKAAQNKFGPRKFNVFGQPQQSTSNPNIRLSFWTYCPFCYIKYEYSREFVNMPLRCQHCFKIFIGYDIGAQGGSMGPGFVNKKRRSDNIRSKRVFQQKEAEKRENAQVKVKVSTQRDGQFPSNFARRKTEDTEGVTKSKVKVSTQREGQFSSNFEHKKTEETEGVTKSKVKESIQREGKFSSNFARKKTEDTEGVTKSKVKASTQREGQFSSNFAQSNTEGVTESKVNAQKSMESGTVKDMNKKRGRKTECNESSYDASKAPGGGPGGNNVDQRISFRPKHASYQEDGYDEFTSQKRSKPMKNSNGIENQKEHESESEPVLIGCPDQEFINFDKVKEEHCFAVDQIWACYDSIDAMPRFYAHINKIYSKFKLRLTWLDPEPDNDLEIKWAENGLPVACGMFVHGETEKTRDRLMFSHQIMYNKKSGSKFSCFISPQKGEIWALYKDWDMDWRFDSKSQKKFKYEVVEILSVNDDCVYVGFLLKVKGFISVFKRIIMAEDADHRIPSSERFRFSHRVPSAKLTGTERAGVPPGSFELDMASLPGDFEDYCYYHEEEVKHMKVKVSTRREGQFSSNFEHKKTEETEGVTKSKVKESIQREGKFSYNFAQKKTEDTEGVTKSKVKASTQREGQFSSNFAQNNTEGVTESKVNAQKSMESGTVKDMNKKRGRKTECNESSYDASKAPGGGPGGNNVDQRISFRPKHASYQEDGYDEFTSQKRSRPMKNSNGIEDQKEHVSSLEVTSDVSMPDGSHSESESKPEVIDCPDQEFINFDEVKEEHCFAVDQIWACYDSIDAMPRFYAHINKIYSKFKLRLTWLDPEPDNDLEIKWAENGLPVACGVFVHGETGKTRDRLMFSHQIMYNKKTGSKFSCVISPQKGEIWALYKDWDMDWRFDSKSQKKFKYEVVEILSVNDDCVYVGFLLKVKGFISVFKRIIMAEDADHRIPSSERFRFSHRVPSAKLTGTERAGVPPGSFELDMASLPGDFEDYCYYHEEEVKHMKVKVSTRREGQFSSNFEHKKTEETEGVTKSKVKESIQREGKFSYNFAQKKTEDTEGVTKSKVKASTQREGQFSSNFAQNNTEGVTESKVNAQKSMESGTVKDMNKKRGRKTECNESSYDASKAPGGGPGGNNVDQRISFRPKHASYQEDGYDEFTSQKRSRPMKNSNGIEDQKEHVSSLEVTSDVSMPDGSHSESESKPEVIDCPDQEFINFDEVKEEHCFAVDQIWACYDSIDAMPRFYAHINKIYSKFKLRLTWLDPEPDNDLEIKWAENGLPVACGVFVHGETGKTRDRLMFSHQIMYNKKTGSKFSCVISPQKGEIWALYKDWDMDWRFDSKSQKKFKYEVVEILSVNDDCVYVGFLLKVKGFISVFKRIIMAEDADHRIPSSERFRFSHRVPSAKLTGTERAGVPPGSFELDMASLPGDFEDYCYYHEEEVKHMKVKVSTRREGQFSSNFEHKKTEETEGVTKSKVKESIQREGKFSYNFAQKKTEDTEGVTKSKVKASTQREGQFSSNFAQNNTEGVTESKVNAQKSMESGTVKDMNKKRGRKTECNESSYDASKAPGGGPGGNNVDQRISFRPKHASYQEDGYDEFTSQKRSRPMKNSNGIEDQKEHVSSLEVTSDVSMPDGSHSESESKPEVIDCPDQEFINFDEVKEEHCFAVDQIWACYDSIDAMPRFYAHINKIYSKFKLRLTWLDPEPDNDLEIKWAENGLPVACGVFVHGETGKTRDRLMFSHQIMYNKKTGSKFSCVISPQKGEIWALYKDWDMDWRFDSKSQKKFKYEVVEILSVNDDCVYVGFLLKVKGFISVFKRIIMAEYADHRIPSSERFRFSHRVPSAKLTGTERAGVPPGSFELDMASLPGDFEDYCYYHEEEVKHMKVKVSTRREGQFSSNFEHKKTEETEGVTKSKVKESIQREGKFSYNFAQKKTEDTEGVTKSKVKASTQREGQFSSNFAQNNTEGVTESKVNAQKSMESGTVKDMNKKRGRKTECNESSYDASKAPGGGPGGNNVDQRISFRPKHASYQEDGYDEFTSQKRSKPMKNSNGIENQKEHESESEPVLIGCPDQEFINFDKVKEEHCFAVDQIWACYDSIDAMPRFYAHINKIYSKFKLRLTWLDPEPHNDLEIKWAENGLPVACGVFVHGETGKTRDRLMFSHQIMYNKKTGSKFSCVISPQKGEIWALYKDWDMNWRFDSKSQKKFKYEVVEILSVNDDCVYVGFLLKVKGFISVFKRIISAEDADHTIPSSERFRFSHRVPSAKLTGTERAGVPPGSFELDMASLPGDFEDYCYYHEEKVKHMNFFIPWDRGLHLVEPNQD